LLPREKFREKALGANHPVVASTLNNLANVNRAQGKYSEAEGVYKRALSIRERALVANHPDVGQTLNNLADVYRAQAKYSEVEALHKRALAIREQVLGANHPVVAEHPQRPSHLVSSPGQRALAIRALGTSPL
jgi:tetratricopeptide (TPR) repeat protein